MKRRIIVLLTVLVIVGGGLAWLAAANPQILERFGRAPSPLTSSIFTSGFIEATDVAIAPEVSGRIVYIGATEGDEIQADVPLVKLDDSLLQAQRQKAEVAVRLAQTGVEQAILSQEKGIASQEQAIASRDGAKKMWENATDIQQNPLELEARIIAAQGELELIQLTLERAGRESLTWGKWDERSFEIRRDYAEKTLQNLLDIKQNPQEINAAVDKTLAAYQTAGKAVEIAEKTVEAARGQVEQAEASLEIVKVRIAHLTLSSPISGVVADRYAEIGEIAQPGVPILTITELAEVTLTAYVPERQIGLVTLGQTALISVDSYPNETFSGRVVHISTRALFTPKNIQLKEDREKMVFGVDIRLTNPLSKLKPGMPADAEILIP